MKYLACTFALCCSLVATSAYAQDVKDCNAALIMNTSSTNSSLSERLSILQSVSQTDFDESKKNLSGGATVLVGDIPVTGNMSWDEFSQKRNSYLSNYKYDLNLETSYAFNNAYLSTTSARAYQICLQSSRPVGTHLWVDSQGGPNSQTIALHVVFNTASGGQPLRLYVNYHGGKPMIDQAQWAHFNNFQGSLDEIVLFRRDSLDQDAGFEASVPAATQNQSDYVRLPARFTVQRHGVPDSEQWESKGHFASNSSQASSGNYCFPSDASDQQQLSAGYTIVNAQSFARPTDGRASQGINPASFDANKACAAWVVNGDKNATGHGADIGLDLVLQRPTWVTVPASQ